MLKSLLKFLTILLVLLVLSVLLPTEIKASTDLHFLHHDHLNSTVAITDESGHLVRSLRYSPFGSSQTSVQTHHDTSLPFLFTSQPLDPETFLYNYSARLYNPQTASFVSADSAQGPNRSAYVRNNPLRFTDPSGKQPQITEDDGGSFYQRPKNYRTLDWLFLMKNGFINLPNQNLAIPAFINLEKYRQQLETVFNIDISLSPKLEYRRDLLDTIKTGLAGQDPNLYRNIEFFLSENPNYSSANFTIINLGLNFSEVTIAHELGHILMQRGDVLSQYDDSFRSIFMEFSRVFINDLSQDPIYKGIPLWNMSVEDTRESFADYWAVFSLGEVNESKISIRSNTIEKFKNNLPETYKYFLWLEEQLPYIMQKTAVKQVSK